MSTPPSITVTNSGGKTCFIIFESRVDVFGVSSLGFSTTVFPAATAPISGANASWYG